MECHGAIIRRRSALGDVEAHKQAQLNIGISREVNMSSVSGCRRSALEINALRAEVLHAIAMRSCRVGRGDYLIVSPEIAWLTEDNDFSADFEVVANVKWIAE